MRFLAVVVICALSAALDAAQHNEPVAAEPKGRLKLAPSEPLEVPPRDDRKPQGERAAPELKTGQQPIRPAILRLKPANDPFHFVEAPEASVEPDKQRTFRRPRVDRISRDADGIALQGYDAVSFWNRQPERGQKQFSFEYLGATWLFSTAPHRDLFARSPETYLPQYGGFCAYSIGKGYPASADRGVWTIHQGKLYFFFDKAVRAVWEQDQGALIWKADRNWPLLHR